MLGLLTFFPALITPRFLDDYLHALMLDGRFPVPRSPFNLYDFVDDTNRALFFERGLLPWWAHPELKLRFLRPLASALLWLEHTLGVGIVLQHLHSFAWWLGAVFSARALFRRVFSPRVALMATFIFALAPCHALPLAWVANRNALLSLVFGLWGLAAYLRLREQPSFARALATLSAFSAALLAGEYALCFTGYVVAYELTHKEPRLARRALALLPLLPVAGYLAARARLDYGAFGSGFYIDPIHEPWTFLRIVPWRLAILLSQGFFTVGTDTWLLGEWSWLVFPFALSSLLALAFLLRGVHEALPEPTRRFARFLLLGALLAVIPVMPSFPSPRVMAIALLGIAPNIALLLDASWFVERGEHNERASYTGMAAVVLGFLHFIHAPVCAWLAASQLQRDASRFVADVTWVGKKLHKLGTSEVVVLRGAVDSLFAPFALVAMGGPWTRWDVLSDPGHMLALRRDERTLELVTPASSALFPFGGLNLFRSPEPRLREGDTFTTHTFALELLAMGEFGPTRARVTFERPLERDRLWIWRQHNSLREVTPPEIKFGLPSDP